MDIDKFLKDLRKEWVERDVPNITEINAAFLRDLIRIKQPKNILEIWTANGYSSIQMGIEAEIIWARITTIEFSSRAFDEAIKNIKAVWFENIITPVFWHARDIIPTLKKTYDFVFIDGMKKWYWEYLDLCLKKTNPWWIVILDDVIKFKKKAHSLWKYLEENNIRHTVLPIDYDDGVCMIIKP